MDMVRLNGVATFIGIVGLTIAAGVLVVLLVIYFTWTYKEPGWIYSIHKGTDRVAIEGWSKCLCVAWSKCLLSLGANTF
ncbi:calcium-transporting ATPase 9, plasma membrane-type-like isoform X2 [Zingiber officinale]|uniref:calcium-transporting ATPase 9, plasma membrane-type-like isoform X2 n=1 Tax=Zingiber officinale TaxID=94328 RepID=UPI001C4CF22A|nr:calcium-transporting ATPase 9, plasma membrane-type-like isoform X2 [Zingiber officinale]